MPAIFASEEVQGLPAGQTVILAPVHDGTAFPPGGKTTGIKDMVDGTSNTILAVQAIRDRAVIWTKPDDLAVDLAQPLAGLEAPGRTRINAVFGDGSVRSLSPVADAKSIKAMFTRGGGEAVP